MNISPPYLSQGSTIGITCPAGAVNMSEMLNMIQQLESWGFQVKVGSTIGTNYFKFSATDQERLQDFQTLLDDNTVDAILFGRGGYGVVRIIDKIDFSSFKRNPKWLLGYSDITCFHSHIHNQFKIQTIHAHMNGGYQPTSFDEFSTKSIYDVLTGNPIQYHVTSHEMNRQGEGAGQLVGGNLALLSDLIGTSSDINTDGKIFFIEDIAEYRYNIDRMMWQLLRAGKLNKLQGLLVGGFTDTQDNEVPFGMSDYEIVWEKIKDFKYPVCFDFPVGHQARNWALKVGANYSFSVNENEVKLYEL